MGYFRGEAKERMEDLQKGRKRKGRRVEGKAETPSVTEAQAPGEVSENRPKTKAELVSRVIQTVEQKLEQGQLKPTVGDFIRLLQLEKELDEEQPREISVSWVEEGKKEDASEK